MTIDYYFNPLYTPCKIVSMVIKHLNLTNINYIEIVPYDRLKLEVRKILNIQNIDKLFSGESS